MSSTTISGGGSAGAAASAVASDVTESQTIPKIVIDSTSTNPDELVGKIGINFEQIKSLIQKRLPEKLKSLDTIKIINSDYYKEKTEFSMTKRFKNIKDFDEIKATHREKIKNYYIEEYSSHCEHYEQWGDIESYEELKNIKEKYEAKTESIIEEFEKFRPFVELIFSLQTDQRWFIKCTVDFVDKSETNEEIHLIDNFGIMFHCSTSDITKNNFTEQVSEFNMYEVINGILVGINFTTCNNCYLTFHTPLFDNTINDFITYDYDIYHYKKENFKDNTCVLYRRVKELEALLEEKDKELKELKSVTCVT